MSQLRLSFLGSPQIEYQGKPVVLPRRKSVALLAFLAVTAVPHSRIFLATLFWPEFDESRGLAYLRRTLWDINQAIGKRWLQIDREQVHLPEIPEIWLDVSQFLALTKCEDKASWQQAHQLYQGEFLQGFGLRDALDFDDWQYGQRERLHRRYGYCLQRLLGAAVSEEQLETAVSYAVRWLSLDILNEEAHRQLMTLYAHLGERATAIQQYEICAQTLADELGLTPEPATKSVIETIRQGLLPSLEPLLTEFSPQQRPTDQIANAPHFLTPFMGRQQQLEQIEALLAANNTPLLTLVGPGGIGKTRLAIEAAKRVQPKFADGVCFVPLVSINQAQAIPFALAEALNVHVDVGREPMTVVLEFLASKKMLTILSIC